MPARLTGLLYLLVTATGWALNWPAMKILLREWPPLFSRGIAGIAAAVLLGVIAKLAGENMRVPRALVPRLLLASAINVFAWMGFSTLSMKWLSVSEGALLVYTMPIWAMLLAWPIAKRKPSVAGFCALALGLAGVVVLLSAHGLSFDGGKLAGIAFALSAAVLFALGTVITHGPMPIPPVTLVAWQVGIGCAPMIVLGLYIEHPVFSALGLDGWAVLVYMSLVPMAVCYLAWFATLRRLPRRGRVHRHAARADHGYRRGGAHAWRAARRARGDRDGAHALGRRARHEATPVTHALTKN